jgi:hypothetical protein
MCVFLIEFHYEDLLSFWKRLGEKVKIPRKTDLSWSMGRNVEFQTVSCKCALQKLESCFKALEMSKSESLLKKYLTREVFEKLKVRKTSCFF